jgi:ribosomal protein S20
MAALLVITALVGGTIIGSVAGATSPRPSTPAATALAAPSASAAARATAAEACAAFRKAFAANLGVDESALVPAAKAAAISTIDAAVAAGRISTDRAAVLKTRVEVASGDRCALLAGRIARIAAAGRGAARPALGIARDGLTAAAKALGLTPPEVGASLRGGKTLKDLATARGVPYATVSAAVLAAVKADLDAAVSAGTIKQAREDRILARLQANLAGGRLRNQRPSAPTTSAAPSSGGTGG